MGLGAGPGQAGFGSRNSGAMRKAGQWQQGSAFGDGGQDQAAPGHTEARTSISHYSTEAADTPQARQSRMASASTWSLKMSPHSP